MAKATAKKQQSSRANPVSQRGRPGKKGPVDKKEASKDPKASHLYTDDNPETTLQGTGFKDEAAATKTISLVSERSLLYQWQVINTMYNRAKHHPHKTKDIEKAIAIFGIWLAETYPKAKAEQRVFKPLSKKTVEALLPDLKARSGVNTAFAEIYIGLDRKKRLANVLVDNSKPAGPDWDRARIDALSKLVPDKDKEFDDQELWEEDGTLSNHHVALLAWAWSPLSEYKLLKGANKG
ncbi:hypothetical protein BD289DRAFT_449529 [Coniella lustricola]|uniref:Uncharacterized protein n=1 Tax=Coniella lustricola TaxID=2025994 RepID=A0A2T3AM12_9PEZI|nr:hypothetical protein BD289DRAFT_449529 [Coniella lustricola]